MSVSTPHLLEGILITVLFLGLFAFGLADEVRAWLIVFRAVGSALRRWIARKPPGEQA